MSSNFLSFLDNIQSSLDSIIISWEWNLLSNIDYSILICSGKIWDCGRNASLSMSFQSILWEILPYYLQSKIYGINGMQYLFLLLLLSFFSSTLKVNYSSIFIFNKTNLDASEEVMGIPLYSLSLIGSCILSICVWKFSHSSRPPSFSWMFSIMAFVNSIIWISFSASVLVEFMEVI